MGLFGKDKKQHELPPLFRDDELDGLAPEATVDFNGVVDYLVGLSDEDYKKLQNYVVVYRHAAKAGAEALGIENEPTTFINPPEAPTVADSTFADDNGKIKVPVKDDEDDLLLDDELEAAFLEDDTTPSAKRAKGSK